MLHFEKTPKKVGQHLAEIQQNSDKICKHLQRNQQNVQQFNLCANKHVYLSNNCSEDGTWWRAALAIFSELAFFG